VTETDPRTPDPPTDAAAARGLVRAADRAALATLDRDGGGPSASLVLVAGAADGAPILLISRLAWHTRNLEADPRASLLIDGTAGFDQPLEGPRVTLLGRFDRLDGGPARDRARARFLARHPDAALYADFGDFGLWRMTVWTAHLVAGFGRIRTIDGPDLLPPVDDAEALAAAEREVVEHMNDDHADAVDLYAGRLLGQAGEGWRMTGIDPEGADLRRGGAVARLPFDKRATTPEEARVELVRLVKRARAAGPGPS
jgi:hypothetical protein